MNCNMGKGPVISIVVPVYGAEPYIAGFAESVLGQSYPHLQFIFVNDGTKDRSVEVLNAIIDSKYPHLRNRITIVQKENGGVHTARKAGMEHVTGDYVYHADPDDRVAPGSMEKIAEVAQNTGADVIYFHHVKEYANRSKVKREALYSEDTKEEYVRAMFNHRAYGALWNKCVKASIYRDNVIHYPKFSYADDCYLSLQLVGYAKKIVCLDEVVYHYSKNNPSSITRQARKRRKREYAMNFLNLYENYRNVPVETNPVNIIMDEILLKAGWYSVLYGLNLFGQYPYLAKGIRKAHTSRGTDVWLPFQLLVKLIAGFKG